MYLQDFSQVISRVDFIIYSIRYLLPVEHIDLFDIPEDQLVPTIHIIRHRIIMHMCNVAIDN